MLYHLVGGLRPVGMDGQRMRLAFNYFEVFIPANNVAYNWTISSNAWT
jgi:hypothetical protein